MKKILLFLLMSSFSQAQSLEFLFSGETDRCQPFNSLPLFQFGANTNMVFISGPCNENDDEMLVSLETLSPYYAGNALNNQQILALDQSGIFLLEMQRLYNKLYVVNLADRTQFELPITIKGHLKVKLQGRLFLVEDDESIHLVNPMTKETKSFFFTSSNPMKRASFKLSRDEKFLIEVTVPKLTVYDVASQKKIHEIAIDKITDDGVTYTSSFSNDDSVFIVAGKQISIIDYKNAVVNYSISQPQFDRFRDLFNSTSDGKKFFVYFREVKDNVWTGHIQFFNLATGQSLGRLMTGPLREKDVYEPNFERLTVSPDSRLIAASRVVTAKTDKLLLIDVETQTVLPDLGLPTIRGYGFSPDSSKLAVSTDDGHLVLIDTKTLKILSRIKFEGKDTNRFVEWRIDSKYVSINQPGKHLVFKVNSN